MKVTFLEADSFFSITLIPETAEEVVKVARFGMNSTKEIRSKGAIFNMDGTSEAYLVMGKLKRSNNYLTTT